MKREKGRTKKTGRMPAKDPADTLRCSRPVIYKQFRRRGEGEIIAKFAERWGIFENSRKLGGK